MRLSGRYPRRPGESEPIAQRFGHSADLRPAALRAAHPREYHSRLRRRPTRRRDRFSGAIRGPDTLADCGRPPSGPATARSLPARSPQRTCQNLTFSGHRQSSSRPARNAARSPGQFGLGLSWLPPCHRQVAAIRPAKRERPASSPKRHGRTNRNGRPGKQFDPLRLVGGAVDPQAISTGSPHPARRAGRESGRDGSTLRSCCICR